MDKIKAEGVKKKFKLKEGQRVNNNGMLSNEIEVLNRVDLSIRKGEFITLVGPSGCGKVYHDEKSIEEPNAKTGYVFQ